MFRRKSYAAPMHSLPAIAPPVSHFKPVILGASTRPSWRLAPRSAQFVVVVLSAWLVVSANWALMAKLGALHDAPAAPWVLRLVFGALAFLAVLTLLSLTAWPRWMKPVWVGLSVVAAFAQHFMLGYGTVMDKGMIANALQTDWRESRDLFTPWLLVQLIVIAGVPALWLWHQPVRRSGALRNVLKTVGLFVLAMGLLLAGVLAGFRQLSPLVRNNMDLRFMINPVTPILATLDATVKPLFKHHKPFASIAAGAVLTPAVGSDKRPPLLVLVVGETARADHFSLNGYGRDTNPELAKRGALSWRQVTSCGTATRESLPCMFSHLGRTDFYASKVEYDGLLDVLQAAGLAVLWVDNQAGCKGVCNRVANVSTEADAKTAAGQRSCGADGECLDEVLVDTLQTRLASMPRDRVKNGVVLVLHQMGSHGPAYFKRSDEPHKAFKPECATNALSECSHEQLVNVYDNSIRYTDHVLAGVIDWLKTQQQYATGMLYVSDHGESLGENGIYLHGMPWALAPEAQKHVPWIMWMDGLQTHSGVAMGCAEKTLNEAASHDNYFHTVLGLVGVQSPTYVPGLDMLSTCRVAPASAERLARAG